MDVATPQSWWELVEGAARRAPAHVMLRDDLGRTCTAEAFHELSLGVAGGLAERGLHAGDVVAWQLPTTIEAAALMSACTLLGVRQVPLLPILRGAELEEILAAAPPALFITLTSWRGFDHGALAASLAAGLGFEKLLVELEQREGAFALPLRPELAPARAPIPSAPTWVFFTSGTTGVPKGVLHSDASAIAGSNALLELVGVCASDVTSIAYPLTHIGGPAMLSAVLRSGASCVLTSSFDPVESPLSLASMDVTVLGSAVPFFLAYLAAQEQHGEEPLFGSLRVCSNGGAPLPGPIADRLRRELGGGVVNGYGLTECPIATFTSPDAVGLDADVVGMPGPGVIVRIVDAEGRDVPAGETGEILLRGPQLFAGYVDPSADRFAFDEQGFLRTGDLGSIEPDGQLRVTGRLKDVIIRNAENISAVEVEGVLAGHPGIVDVAVVGVPDDHTGERACAVIVAAPEGPPVTIASLGAFCGERGLARFKVPEQILVVDELPRTAMGKVRKDELRVRAAAAPVDVG